MADQEDGGAGFLGIAHQPRRALAHLAHRARRCGQRFGPQGLYRVGHDQLRPRHAGVLQDVFDAGFGQRIQAFQRQIQAHRTSCDLGQRFFAGDVQHRQRTGHAGQCLQQQRRLADAGVATDQHHRAFDQTAAQHPIELADAGGHARLFGLAHVLERVILGASVLPDQPVRREAAGDALPPGVALSSTISLSVFHTPHSVHCPCHLLYSAPHSPQT